jgi:hypothetical protein
MEFRNIKDVFAYDKLENRENFRRVSKSDISQSITGMVSIIVLSISSMSIGLRPSLIRYSPRDILHNVSTDYPIIHQNIVIIMS